VAEVRLEENVNEIGQKIERIPFNWTLKSNSPVAIAGDMRRRNQEYYQIKYEKNLHLQSPPSTNHWLGHHNQSCMLNEGP
jgi:hypothetical protein